MATGEMLSRVKKAIRVTTMNFDDEISGYINAAMLDMGVAGVEIPEQMDDLVLTAIIAYVKAHFGDPDAYDRWKGSYDEQKAQLVTCTGYTDWGVNNGQI